MSCALELGCTAQESSINDDCAPSIVHPIVISDQPMTDERQRAVDKAVEVALGDSEYVRAAAGRYLSKTRECYVAPRWLSDQRLIVQIYVKDTTLDEVGSLSTKIQESLRRHLTLAQVTGVLVTEEVILTD